MRYLMVLLTSFLLMAEARASTLDLTPPFRLLATGIYLDGGTIYFVLVDAKAETLRGGFDARGPGGLTCPHKCFVGGDYPDKPGVRLLPLWGPEERKLVRLLDRVVGDLATATEAHPVLRARSGSEVQRNLIGGQYGLRGAVERRKQNLDAIDHGLLLGTDVTHMLFSGADTSRVRSLIRLQSPERFLVTFQAADGEEIRIGFPASLDSVMSRSSFGGRKFDSRELAGTWIDRMMITLVLMALERDRALLNELDRQDLLRILELRRSKILEADAGC